MFGASAIPAIPTATTAVRGGVILGTEVREKLTANRTYYVRTDGDDANSGLVNNSGGAFLTLAAAIAKAKTIDWSIYRITIQLGAGSFVGTGTYTGAFLSAQSLLILGDTGTPSNVTLTFTGNGFWAFNGFNAEFSGVTFSASGFCALNAASGSNLRVGSNCRFANSPTFAHVFASGGFVDMYYAHEITANCAGVYRAEYGGFIDLRTAGYTITLTGTPAWSIACAYAANGGVIAHSGHTFSGSATGKRFSALNGGMIGTNGGGASYFPGDVAGTGTNLGASPYGQYT